MSDLIVEKTISDSKDCPCASAKPVHELIPTHKAMIGEGLTIRRALPHAQRRMIGAWCFLDHFGPLDLSTGNGLNIAPHPHMGLQTFTWLLAGEILHRDSLGYNQIIQPGQVNLMTSGYGIAHSEESLPDTLLHGVQLWIALPDSFRNETAAFEHHEQMPVIHKDGLKITVLAGDFLQLHAPTTVHSPMMGLDLQAESDVTTTLPLNPEFEYGLLPLMGDAQVEDVHVDMEHLIYLGCGRKELNISMPNNARAILIGGKPFAEEILMWWNFVARTKEEIVQGVNDWNNHTRFGEVKDYGSGRLNAPDAPIK